MNTNRKKSALNAYAELYSTNPGGVLEALKADAKAYTEAEIAEIMQGLEASGEEETEKPKRYEKWFVKAKYENKDGVNVVVVTKWLHPETETEDGDAVSRIIEQHHVDELNIQAPNTGFYYKEVKN